MAQVKGPTKSDRLILEAIREYWSVNEYGPSFRDLASMTSKHVGTVQSAIGRLERFNCIKRTPKAQRSVRINKTTLTQGLEAGPIT